MHNKLIKHFEKIMPLSAIEKNAIIKNMKVQTFKKGSILLREGQISTECYFVFKGCVREYYIFDGEEKTTNFFTDEQFVVSLNSFSQKIPATHYFECSEDCVLMIGNEKKENELYKQFPKFETISRKVMENIYGNQQEKMVAFMNNSPEERYLNLMETRPDLFQIIPQFQIARYLGIKPESLSRIKKRIFKPEKSL